MTIKLKLEPEQTSEISANTLSEFYDAMCEEAIYECELHQAELKDSIVKTISCLMEEKEYISWCETRNVIPFLID